MKLSEAGEGYEGRVKAVAGSVHFLSRAVSIGVVEGSTIQVLQNCTGQPVLFYCRDSVVALNRRDCEGIEMEEMQNGSI